MSATIKISKLFIHDPLNSRSQADVFLGSSQTDHTTKLIVVCEFPRSGRTDQSYLIDAIIKQAVETFDIEVGLSAEIVLEKILEELNFLLPQISPKKNTPWLQELNLLVGVLKGQEIDFSSINHMYAWLLHDNSFSQISPKPGPINPLKLFTNITDGHLSHDDTLLFTNAALTDYVSEIKIKQILTDSHPGEAVEKFDLLLEQVPRFVTFCSVIIKITPSEAPARILRTPRQQLEKELGPERVSELQPSRVPLVANRRRRRSDGLNGLNLSFGSVLLQGLKFLGKNALIYFVVLGQIIKQIIKGLLIIVKCLVNKDFRQRNEKMLWEKLESHWEDIKRILTATAGLQRWLVVATAVILLVFLNIIIFRGQSLQVNKHQDSFNETLLTISQKQSEADSSRTFKDDKKAEGILMEISNMLAALAPLNKNQEEELAQLKDKNDRDLSEVRHINNVGSPLLLQDLSTLDKTVLGLGLANNQTYITTTDGLYKLSAAVDKILARTLTQGQLLVNSRNQIYILDQRSLQKLNGAQISETAIKWNTNLKSIDQALMYADNIYVLDRQSGSIYKHSGTANGDSFGTGAVWLNEPSLIGSSQSFAIDGNIWLINDAGEIVKLFKSQRQAFDYQRPSPAFGGGSKILTNKNSSYLYILDPTNKRVAIIDKKGNIKDQFTSSKFDNLKSLTVDSEEKIIYLLNGNQVYQLAIKK